MKVPNQTAAVASAKGKRAARLLPESLAPSLESKETSGNRIVGWSKKLSDEVRGRGTD